MFPVCLLLLLWSCTFIRAARTTQISFFFFTYNLKTTGKLMVFKYKGVFQNVVFLQSLPQASLCWKTVLSGDRKERKKLIFDVNDKK